MKIKLKDKKGLTLKTKDKLCNEDIQIVLDESISGGGSEDYPSESIAYYKQTRNKDYPYFPLPYEMTDEQDTIYMLYDANGYMCCPVFYITYTDCVVTVQKYMNTTLVSEYTLNDVVSGTTYRMQFSEEDSDYSTYNYIVIKLQGNITSQNLDINPTFNGVTYNNNSTRELIEVSGKCASCDIKVVNQQNYGTYKKLEYFSFVGINRTDMSYMFNNCYSLQAIPQLDTSKATNMSYMFRYCYSLQAIPQLDTSNATNMSYMFNYCYSLQTIPQLDTSKATDMSYMFNYCTSLKVIPSLDFASCTNCNYWNYIYLLIKVDMYNVKASFQLSHALMLTQDELVKILNNLATVTTTQTLTLGSKNLAKLTDEEKAIATNKGWTLA